MENGFSSDYKPALQGKSYDKGSGCVKANILNSGWIGGDTNHRVMNDKLANDVIGDNTNNGGNAKYRQSPEAETLRGRNGF